MKPGPWLCRAVLAILFAVQPHVSVAEEESPEEAPFTVEANVGLYSDYMFRGFNLYDGTSVQPSITAAYSFGDWGTLSGSYWMHLSAEGDRKEEGFTESDETIAYDVTFGPVSLSLGHVWYTYPDDSDPIDDSAELFAVLSYDTFLKPTLGIWEDYRLYDTQYYELGFSHTIATDSLGKGFAVTPFVALGFASNGEKIYDENGLVQITEGFYAELPLGDITVTPTVNYSHKVDDATVNEFWMGVAFAYTF